VCTPSAPSLRRYPPSIPVGGHYVGVIAATRANGPRRSSQIGECKLDAILYQQEDLRAEQDVCRMVWNLRAARCARMPDTESRRPFWY
jgi:hypothetical protein